MLQISLHTHRFALIFSFMASMLKMRLLGQSTYIFNLGSFAWLRFQKAIIGIYFHKNKCWHFLNCCQCSEWKVIVHCYSNFHCLTIKKFEHIFLQFGFALLWITFPCIFLFLIVLFLVICKSSFYIVDVKFLSFIIFLNQLSVILFMISLAIPKLYDLNVIWLNTALICLIATEFSLSYHLLCSWIIHTLRFSFNILSYFVFCLELCSIIFVCFKISVHF